MSKTKFKIPLYYKAHFILLTFATKINIFDDLINISNTITRETI